MQPNNFFWVHYKFSDWAEIFSVVLYQMRKIDIFLKYIIMTQGQNQMDIENYCPKLKDFVYEIKTIKSETGNFQSIYT